MPPKESYGIYWNSRRPLPGGMVYMIMASLDTYGGGVKETCFGAASFFCGCGENGIERLRAGGPSGIQNGRPRKTAGKRIGDCAVKKRRNGGRRIRSGKFPERLPPINQSPEARQSGPIPAARQESQVPAESLIPPNRSLP